MCTRGVFISIEGSPSSVDTKFAILEAYLTSIGISYHTFFPNDDSTLGSILFDIEHSMFTEYTPESIFLLQCAFFNQHAQRIEELLYRGKIVIACRYIHTTTQTAASKFVSDQIIQAASDIPYPDHTFIIDFDPEEEALQTPYHYSRTLESIRSFHTCLLQNIPEDSTLIPRDEKSSDFLFKIRKIISEKRIL